MFSLLSFIFPHLFFFFYLLLLPGTRTIRTRYGPNPKEKVIFWTEKMILRGQWKLNKQVHILTEHKKSKDSLSVTQSLSVIIWFIFLGQILFHSSIYLYYYNEQSR